VEGDKCWSAFIYKTLMYKPNFKLTDVKIGKENLASIILNYYFFDFIKIIG